MIAFTVLLGSMVTFILPMGILLLNANPQSLSLAAVWLFFIIMGPGVASPIYKLTFLGGNTREINEGVVRSVCCTTSLKEEYFLEQLALNY